MLTSANASADVLRFMPVGDSYTIGEGVAEMDRWPNQVVALLRDRGVEITLVDNPGRTGWTTAEAITRELPLLKQKEINIATVLIGVNDWVRGDTVAQYGTSLKELLDGIQKDLPDNSRLVLITIPDFGVTPAGAVFGRGRDVSKGIAEFNSVIAAEAKRRKLPLVDIYPLSRRAKERSDYIAPDGLHPSAIQYRAWTPLIAEKLLAIAARTSDNSAPSKVATPAAKK